MTETDLSTTQIYTSKTTRRRVWLGSLSGSSIEWFDFFLYATAAAVVFDKLYFPNDDPFVSLMLSYLTLALTYFFRPLGGVIFAHIGDRIGRKKTLVITLCLMGGATVGIGLVPTYDSIGLWAPIILVLLRIVQGTAVGGEWGGALLLAYEYAPENRRGLFGSIPQMGVTIGLLLATAAFSLMSLLPDDVFFSWGWRAPFIGSILLVLIGLWIRSGLAETPAFLKAQEKGKIASLPIAYTIRHHWRAVLVAIGAKFVETAPYYIFATFVVSYTTGILDIERSIALNSVTVGALVATIAIPLSGRLSDSLGRQKVFLFGSVALALYAFPYFSLLGTGNTWTIVLASIIGLGILWPLVTATIGSLTAELFSTQARYTGISLGYQVGAAIFGGSTPLIATWLLSQFGGNWLPVAIFMVVAAVVSIIAVSAARSVAKIEAQQAEVSQ